MSVQRFVTVEEIDFIATGAWILGTGGGGDPYLGSLALKALYADGARVPLIGASDLPDDAMVGVVSQMGAPVVNLERTVDPEMTIKPVLMMERHAKRQFDALMLSEIGGGNALQPLIAGAKLGRPVVDADTMGRAFPSVFHTSFAIGDLVSHPYALADIRNNEIMVMKCEDWLWNERMARKILVEWGSRAFSCKAPRTGREVKEWGIHGSVSQAIDIGRAVHTACQQHDDPIEAVLKQQRGRRLFGGKVIDVERRATAGHLRGVCEFDGLDADRGTKYRLEFQNEFLVGRRDGEIEVTTPDLICVLDSVSGEAVGTERLRYGQRVTVIALPSPKLFLTPKGLHHTAPRAFGLDFDFVSAFGAGAGK
ncbi:MAG: DUF917 domain-containing protein [Proteobacteria bacterium]|nr:DUF917 domain-containing protein [Pseudomonadota bacterium]